MAAPELIHGQRYRLPNGETVTFHSSPISGMTFRSVHNRFEFYQVKGDGSLTQHVLRIGKRTSTFHPIVDAPTGFTLDDIAPVPPDQTIWTRIRRACRRAGR